MDLLLFYFVGSLVAYSLLVLVLFALSARLPIAQFYARILSSWACLVLCAAYGVVASIALRCVGYSGLSQWTVARAFKWTMRFATGIEFVVQGETHLKARPAVFIGNHQTLVAHALQVGRLRTSFAATVTGAHR